MTAERVHVRASSAGQLISVIPRMLGYQPADGSMVIVGVTCQPGGRQRIGFLARYDLSERGLAAKAADHAQEVLNREGMRTALAIGYGPGQRVTPDMDVIRQRLADAGIRVWDAVRVHEGRWHSYVCTDPACHPVDGTPLEADRIADPVLDRLGPARASREELAATIAPLAGEQADAQREIDGRVAGERRLLAMSVGRNASRELYRAAAETVDKAIAAVREGAEVSDADHARLAQAMTDIRIRDRAWAHMDPAYAEQHQQLWTATVRRAQPGAVAASASLLAFTAAQQGRGALANVALERARADDPGYSMASLLQRTLDAGVRPGDYTAPMTPEEADAAYGYPGRDEAAAPERETSPGPAAVEEREPEAGA